jgi:hypothetical protein
MKIAYVISAYKLPQQLVRLVQRLQAPGVTFLIHVDAKTEEGDYRQMAGPLAGWDNVIFLTRHPCHWGDFGHVQASLKGIDELFKRQIAFDRVVLLTGQDYPLRSHGEICDFFEKHRGEELVNFFPLPFAGWSFDREGLRRYEVFHFRMFGKHCCFPPEPSLEKLHLGKLWRAAGRVLPLGRRIPLGHKPFGGSSYWALTQRGAQYVQRFVSEQPGYVDFFKRVWIPDEMFFQTLLLNSPLRESVRNELIVFVHWGPGALNPTTFGPGDWAELSKASKLFARKFDMTRDPSLLEMIDEQLLSTRSGGKEDLPER